MSDQKPAYQHQSEMTGADPDPTATTEHRDTVTKGPGDRNELDLEQRNKEKEHGPETYSPRDSTTVARKEGASRKERIDQT
jgi:hypothetical protein